MGRRLGSIVQRLPKRHRALSVIRVVSVTWPLPHDVADATDESLIDWYEPPINASLACEARCA